MAFATGVTASLDEFITALVSFAVTNAGFTNLSPVTSSGATGSRTIQRIQKNGITWNFTRTTGNNTLQAAMSYTPFGSGVALVNSGVALGNATAQQYWTEMNTFAFTGPFAGHYFFTDGNAVHAVLEIAAGIFNHISFGNIIKSGTWTGGEYLTGGWYGGTYTSGSVTRYRDAITTGGASYACRPFDCDAADNAGLRGGYMRIANTSATVDFGRIGFYSGQTTDPPVCGFVGAIPAGSQYPYSLYGTILRDSPSTATGRSPLLPGIIRMRQSVGGLLRVAGTVQNIAITKISLEMNPKDIVNTDWQIFPLTSRTGADFTVVAPSYDYALAYRRV